MFEFDTKQPTLPFSSLRLRADLLWAILDETSTLFVDAICAMSKKHFYI